MSLLDCLHVRFHPVLPGLSQRSLSFGVDEVYLHCVHHVAFDITIYSVDFRMLCVPSCRGSLLLLLLRSGSLTFDDTLSTP